MIRVAFVALAVFLSSVGPLIALSIVPLGSGGVWARSEFQIDGVPAVTRPFDPEVVALDAVFTLPSGKTMTVPAFWDQPYQRVPQQGAEKLTPNGAPRWLVRFSPPEPGQYSMRVEVRQNGVPSGEPATGSFFVPGPSASDAAPPLRVAASRQCFETVDGRPVPLVGANVCWPGQRGTFDYDDWFGAMALAGENCARLWMAPWAFGIEAEPGTLTQYRLDRAWQLDYVMRLAEAKGIYLILCLDFHGMFEVTADSWGGNNFWPKNPYAAAQGGPCGNQNAFFTNSEAMRLYQKRLRYLVARFGSSGRLLAWEFFNEIDNVYGYLNPTDVARWHGAMGAWLHANDPYGHLVTTSFGSSGDRPEIWNLPDLDFVTYHSYNLPRPATGLAQAVQSLRARYQKPVLIEEFGVDWRGWGETLDPHLRGFRQSLWSGALNGSAGASMSWWWEKIHTEQIYPLFKTLDGFIAQTKWGVGEWKPIGFRTAGDPPALVGNELPGGSTFTAELTLNSQWGAKLRGQMAVPTSLSAMSAGMYLNSFFHGTGHPELRVPCKVSVWLGENGRVVLRLNSVSQGAILSVQVDGVEKLRQSLPNKDGSYAVNNEYNQDFSVAVPSGKHLIEVRNPGGDWFYLDWIRIENVATAEYGDDWRPSPAAVGSTGAKEALLYVVNPAAEYPVNATVPAVEVLTGASLELTNLPAGPYRSVWSDPKTGVAMGQTTGYSDGGTLKLPLPTFAEDLAGRMTREFQFGPIAKGADGSARLLIWGWPGQTFSLEVSSNLSVWQSLGVFVNTNGAAQLSDRTASGEERRYYRAMAPD